MKRWMSIEVSVPVVGCEQGSVIRHCMPSQPSVAYLRPLLEPALAETLGVIVFQEQVLRVARDLAGFTPGRAELLRRALSHKRADEQVARKVIPLQVEKG
jgi:DNA polymerase III alpha subunit